MDQNKELYISSSGFFYGEIEKVTQLGKEIYSYKDFSHFDNMNIGVKKDLNKFYDTLENIHDMTILDLGSGTGCESRYLAETYGCKVYSLDYSDEMCSINNAINKLCGLDILITVICDDAASLNLSEYNLEGQCDLVITIQSMLFVTEKEKLWNLCNRALKVNGKLYIEDFLVDKRFQPAQEEQNYIDNVLQMKSKLDPSEYCRDLWNAGFFIDTYQYNGYQKSLCLFGIAENYLRNKQMIIDTYGQQMWDGRPTSYVDHAVFTIAHRTDLTLEEIQQQFPLLFNYKGQSEFERWLNKRQIVILSRFACTKL